MTPAVPLDNSLETFLIDLAAASPELEAQERADARLSADEVERAEKIAGAGPDGGLWRACRIALRIALERWAGGDIRRQSFVVDGSGRPALARGAPHFSISHSGAVALIAINGAAPVGVDVETRRTLRISDDRRARLVHAARTDATQGTSARFSASDECVLQSWVRLEAVAKASGDGIGRVLTDLGVVGSGRSRDLALRNIQVRDLELSDGLFGAIAAAHLPARIGVRRFPSDAVGIARLCAEAAGRSR